MNSPIENSTSAANGVTGEAADQKRKSPPRWGRRLLVLLAVAAVFVFIYTQFGEYLSLEKLARHESAFRQYQQDHPILIYAAAFTAYVVVTGLSLPGAAGMTLLMGWLFGFWRAVVLVSFASTAGAALAFLLSRCVVLYSPRA